MSWIINTCCHISKHLGFAPEVVGRQLAKRELRLATAQRRYGELRMHWGAVPVDGAAQRCRLDPALLALFVP